MFRGETKKHLLSATTEQTRRWLRRSGSAEDGVGVKVLAGEGRRLFGPHTLHQRRCFVELLEPFLEPRERKAITSEFLLEPTAAQADDDTAGGYVVQGGGDLGEQRRIAEADRGDQGTELHALGHRAHGGQRRPG